MPELALLARRALQGPAGLGRQRDQFVNELEGFGQEQLGGLNQIEPTLAALRDTSIQANRGEAAAAAGAQADATSEGLAGQLRRRQRALGLNLSDRQQRAQSRRLSLTRALARAQAETGSARESTDLAREANRAGMGFQDSLFDLTARGLSQLANAEGQRNAREAQRRAQKRADRNSLIGTALGIGASLLSSEAVKDKEGPAENVLDKLRKIRVERWRYKGDGNTHIGAYAEEFNDTFGVSQNERHTISLVDAVGVMMGAIKELDEKVSHG